MSLGRLITRLVIEYGPRVAKSVQMAYQRIINSIAITLNNW